MRRITLTLFFVICMATFTISLPCRGTNRGGGATPIYYSVSLNGGGGFPSGGAPSGGGGFSSSGAPSGGGGFSSGGAPSGGGGFPSGGAPSGGGGLPNRSAPSGGGGLPNRSAPSGGGGLPNRSAPSGGVMDAMAGMAQNLMQSARSMAGKK